MIVVLESFTNIAKLKKKIHLAALYVRIRTVMYHLASPVLILLVIVIIILFIVLYRCKASKKFASLVYTLCQIIYIIYIYKYNI